MSDYRIACGLRYAARCKPTFAKIKPKHEAAKLGLTYERAVGKELMRHANIGNFIEAEHNPWFQFTDDYGMATCSPDFLLRFERGIIVVEIKLSWVPDAAAKLRDLYLPVVELALRVPIVAPLVICKYVKPETPRPVKYTLREAMLTHPHVMQWTQNGRMLW